MITSLTTEEKSTIIDGHLRTLDFEWYDVYIELTRENGAIEINQSKIDELTAKKNNIESKISALNAEKLSL